MRRRGFVTWLLALPLMARVGLGRAQAAAPGRVRPGEAGWPTDDEWDGLRQAVGGRLEKVVRPKLDRPEAERLLHNPFYLRDEPAFTSSSGWLNGWRSAPSAYVVKARDAADVAAAVKFASAHRLRLVVRGGGHSYLGGSCAPDSLLVWTRDMNDIALHDAFVPQGCHAKPVPAVSLGAGCVWVEAYEAVTNEGGRYVQGGGCTSVGVAGLVLGGGFGSFSKGFGLAAASLLEAEIVTADGEVRIVNACREPDLSWALKGGGQGAFGVVTRLTLATHDLPSTFGGVNWTVEATSDDAYRRLLRQFLAFYGQHLMNPHWGEQAHAAPNNRLEVGMAFQGLTPEEATAAWKVLTEEVAAHPDDYRIIEAFGARAAPARVYWNGQVLNKFAPGLVKFDDRPGAKPGAFWYPDDGKQCSIFWHGYQSAWLPAALLEDRELDRLADAWFAASRHWSVSLHFNKGLAGASPEVADAARQASINPQAADAFALAIIAMAGGSLYPELTPPDLAVAREHAVKVDAAMQALRKAAPDAGCYMSECDYFLADWRRAQWGGNWQRLEAIKRRYDPDGLFIIHHGVGSEDWSEDGFQRA
jgi:FAD/FMN-containing dehydrogenase